jgi:hypothetical protein
LIEKIISGAQTGADRAGLDAALHLGLFVGGTVPRGRMTEDGPLSDDEMRRYNLVESKFMGYPSRTRANVRDSDGTVIFGDQLSPGTQKTIRLCDDLGTPFLANPTKEVFLGWSKAMGIRTLNVAGNRESRNPGIYERTLVFLLDALWDPTKPFEMYGEKTPTAAYEKLKRMRAAKGVSFLATLHTDEKL